MLTLTQSTSYSFLSAFLIWRLLARTSTMKTSVLFSSIFFMADSVLSGLMSTVCSSRRGSCGTLLRGYLGFRLRRRVLGRWKVVLRRILRTLCELTCSKNKPSAVSSWMLVLTRLKVVDVGQDHGGGMLTPRSAARAALCAFLPALFVGFAPVIGLCQ